jgi:hypothetical protein
MVIPIEDTGKLPAVIQDWKLGDPNMDAYTDEQVRFLLDAPLVLDREMEDIDRACIMRMSDWIVHVKDGTFINYDGHAHYCDGVHISRHYVYPSDYLAGYMDTSIPHICWYNK